VGEVRRYLPDAWVCDPDAEALADGIEQALRHGWQADESVEERLAFAGREAVIEAWSEVLATLEA